MCNICLKYETSVGSPAAVLLLWGSCCRFLPLFFFSSKINRGQWLLDSITLRKEGSNEMLAFSGDFAFGKAPKATVCWLIIWAGVSPGWFRTEYSCSGCVTRSRTSPGYGQDLRCTLCIHFLRHWKILLAFHDGLSFVLYHPCWWDDRKNSLSGNGIWSHVFWVLDRGLTSVLWYLFLSWAGVLRRNVGDHPPCAESRCLHPLWCSPWRWD